MSHGITNNDQMFSVREMPWHGLGVVLDQYPQSIDEALEKARLGWKVTHGDVLVVKTPEWSDDFGAKHPPELIQATGSKVNLREDTGEVLGINRRLRAGRQPRRVPVPGRADRLGQASLRDRRQPVERPPGLVPGPPARVHRAGREGDARALRTHRAWLPSGRPPPRPSCQAARPKTTRSPGEVISPPRCAHPNSRGLRAPTSDRACPGGTRKKGVCGRRSVGAATARAVPKADRARWAGTGFSARYTAEMAQCGGRCPIEAGVLGRLADHECRHGRLPFDRSAFLRLLAAGGRRGARALGPCDRRVPPGKARRLNPCNQIKRDPAIARTTATPSCSRSSGWNRAAGCDAA